MPRCLALAVTLLFVSGIHQTSEAASCPAPNFIPGTVLVDAPGDEYVKATFKVSAQLTDIFYVETAYHRVGASGGPLLAGLAAERAVAGLFVEDATGTVLETTAFAVAPYGSQVTIADAVVPLEILGTECAAGAAGVVVSLSPGTYNAVSLAGSDSRSGHGLALPGSDSITDVRVSRGPMTVLTEAEYDCAFKLRAELFGLAAEALLDCHNTYPAAHHAYRLLFAASGPDAQHDVQWIGPDGTAVRVDVFDIDRGPAGTWALRIPTYVTPLGSGYSLGTPLDPVSEDGVVGAFADIP